VAPWKQPPSPEGRGAWGASHHLFEEALDLLDRHVLEAIVLWLPDFHHGSRLSVNPVEDGVGRPELGCVVVD
jgi:hypothetical protein